MILKSYIVEKNFDVLGNYQAVLLYGENDGIQDDIKLKLKDENKDSEIMNFFESEIVKNKNILYDNILNESLFNEKKIIIIQSATDKILNEISECLKKINENIKIYIFSENLDKKSKLRSLFEKEKNLAIFACYEDNERTLIEYISKEMNGFRGLTGELINHIIANASSNRKIIKSEIIKIKNFFVEKVINKKDLLEILNIKNNTGFEEIRDNALMGRKEKTNRLLSEINILNEDSFLYLNNLNYRILKLIDIQKSNKNYNDIQRALENFKPQVFWKDKTIYLQQLRKWNLKQLYQVANKISDTETLMKKNSQIRNDVVVKELIVSIVQKAATSS